MKLQDVVLTNKDQNLATFIVKPTNKSTTAYLSSLEFSLGTKFPSISNADDYFEVKIGNEIADNLSIDGTTLTVSDINIDITTDTQVTVTYKEKLTADDNTDDDSAYVLTLNNVNGKS
jgi:sporulation protein YlmC with PRC-barrel domain